MEQALLSWRFQLDQDDLGEREGWYELDFDASDWAIVPVPCAWDHYDHALRNYEGIAWFSAEIPSDWIDANQYQSLYFQSVSGHAKVWVNGVLLGEHIGRYLPFEFLLPSNVRHQGPCTVVVRVDNEHRKEWLPGGPVVEWVHYGGILQPVKLITKNPVHICDLSIRTTPLSSGAEVYVEADVVNYSNKELEGVLTLYIHADNDVHTAALAVGTIPWEHTRVHFAVVIPNLTRWDLDDPVLHEVNINLTVDSQTVDTVEDRFGFRTFTISRNQFLLNDKVIPIHGVNRYDEYEPYGVTVPEEIIRQDFLRMKQAGINFVRVHYPQDPIHLRIMDEIGMLFLEEIPINWWRVDPTQPAWASTVIDVAEVTLIDMVRRDKNHPCLVVWSMANESDTDTEIGITAMRRLIRKTRELDPTRLVTFVVHTDTKGHDAFNEADFIGINLYFGLHQGPVAHHIEEFDDLVRKPTQKRLEEIAAQYPDKPIVMTEFGTHSINGLKGNIRFTETYQGEYIKAVWKAIQNVPAVEGGILWSWADYYHQRDFIGRGAGPIHSVFGPYGVVTVDRKEKSSLSVLSKLFRDEV